MFGKLFLCAGVWFILFFSPQASLFAATDADGFVSLFDGKTLSGWRGYQSQDVPANWSVADGQLKGGGKGPDLVTKETFADFELRFEWKLESDGNSGVIYRATEKMQRAHRTGIEYQLIDDHPGPSAVPPVKSTGAIYGLYCHDKKTLNPVGEFNKSRILAKGSHLEHWLNGNLVAECEIGSDDWKKKIAASKFQSWEGFAQNAEGHIALQSHGHPIWFRNIQIKRLESAKVQE